VAVYGSVLTAQRHAFGPTIINFQTMCQPSGRPLPMRAAPDPLSIAAFHSMVGRFLSVLVGIPLPRRRRGTEAIGRFLDRRACDYDSCSGRRSASQVMHGFPHTSQGVGDTVAEPVGQQAGLFSLICTPPAEQAWLVPR